MEDREKARVEEEARAHARESRRTTAYGNAINRYLGAFSYAEWHVDRKPVPVPTAERNK